MTRTRRTWLAAGIAGAALLSASHAHAVDPSCPFGVNAHQASNQALDLAAAAGIGWVRFDMNWLQFEPDQKGNFNWTEADRFMQHAAQLGLNVFVTVAYTPMWAVGVPCNDADPNDANWCHNAPPANPLNWTDFVTAAVTRYGASVKAWGMWNEPNLKSFFKGTRDQYVTTILVPGSAAVHAACADCLVLGPELSNLRSADWDGDQGDCYPGVGCRYNAWEYSLTEILKAAGGSIDIITHHKYTDTAEGMWSELADGVKSYGLEVNHGLKVILDGVAPGKPVWLTEFGWESEPFGSNTNAAAAQQLTGAFQGMVAIQSGTQPNVVQQPWPELKKLFWYDLVNDPNGYSWGLLDDALGKKEPYDAYAAVIASLGPCGSGAGGAAGSGAGGSGTGGVPGAGGGGGSATGGSQGDASTGAGGSSAGGSGTNANGVDPTAGPQDAGCGCRATESRDSGRAAFAFVIALLIAARRGHHKQSRERKRAGGYNLRPQAEPRA